MFYKYGSPDCYEYISLHDHRISKIVVKKKHHGTENIALIFDDGFDVAKTHPLNDTGESKHTSSSRIDLINAKFLNGEVFCFNQDNQQINLAVLLDGFSEFEILKFERIKATIYLEGNIDTMKFTREFAILSFSCDKAIFYWNDYSSDAWSEGFPQHTK